MFSVREQSCSSASLRDEGLVADKLFPEAALNLLMAGERGSYAGQARAGNGTNPDHPKTQKTVWNGARISRSRHGLKTRKPFRGVCRETARSSSEAQRALMRPDRRDSLRATVFFCSTPLVMPRCISGCAALNASAAAALSPASIAVSTFLTKVRMRLTRLR